MTDTTTATKLPYEAFSVFECREHNIIDLNPGVCIKCGNPLTECIYIEKRAYQDSQDDICQFLTKIDEYRKLIEDYDETTQIMTVEEWASISAKSRFQINMYSTKTKAKIAAMQETLGKYANKNNWGKAPWPELAMDVQDAWIGDDGNGYDIAEKTLIEVSLS